MRYIPTVKHEDPKMKKLRLEIDLTHGAATTPEDVGELLKQIAERIQWHRKNEGPITDDRDYVIGHWRLK